MTANDFYEKLMAKSTRPCEPNNRVNERLVVFENVFTEKECDEALKSFDHFSTDIGTVGKPKSDDYSEENYNHVLDSTLRNCLVTYADRLFFNSWIHDRIEKKIVEANEEAWKCQITDFSQPMRLMTYRAGHHFGSWHQDNGVLDTSFRKLTAIVQLSKPEEYEGGEFLIAGHPTPAEAYKQGSVIVFPCYLMHRVTQVISGERNSIVHRAIGEPFR